MESMQLALGDKSHEYGGERPRCDGHRDYLANGEFQGNTSNMTRKILGSRTYSACVGGAEFWGKTESEPRFLTAESHSASSIQMKQVENISLRISLQRPRPSKCIECERSTSRVHEGLSVRNVLRKVVFVSSELSTQ